MGYAADIRFILEEAERIFWLFQERRLKELKLFDLASPLPHPAREGGQLYIGEAAAMRMQELARTALQRSQYADRLDVDAVRQALAQQISWRFLKAQRAVDKAEAKRAIQTALEEVAKSIMPLAHYFPCDVFKSTTRERLTLGPVVIHRRDARMPALEPALANRYGVGVGPDGREKGLGPEFVEDLQDYYANFGCIAEVRIEDCDEKTSRSRAQKVARAAIDCIQLAAGPRYFDRIRIGGYGVRRDRRAHFAVGPDDRAAISARLSWEGGGVEGDAFWDSAEASLSRRLMGLALEHGLHPSSATYLSQRFIEAAAWYGEAARDASPASRFVKYALAIERILVTPSCEGRIDQTWRRRGAALGVLPGESRRELRGKLAIVYGLRSRIIHGAAMSPLSRELLAGVALAEDLARRVLFGALNYYGETGLTKASVTDEALDAAYDRIIAEEERPAGEEADG